MSKEIMNNKDFRRIIFSYFRNPSQIFCQTCKKVCLLDNKVVNKYMELPIKDHTVIYYQCMQCYWHATTREMF